MTAMKLSRFVSLRTIRRAGTFVLPAVLGTCVFLVYVFLPLAAVSHGFDLREDDFPGGEGGEAGGATVRIGDACVYLGRGKGTIWVHAAPDGRRFTLRNPGGQVIAENLTEEELRASFPEHWETVERGFANPGTPLDASGPADASFPEHWETIERGFANPGAPLDASGPAEWFLQPRKRVWMFPPLRGTPGGSDAR